MAHLSVSVLTTEYVRVPVVLTDSGLPVDPTSLPVQLAFPPTDEAPSDWISGSWETENGRYLARALIGTGGCQLTAGDFDVWVKITSSPEIPVRRVGVIEVK